MSAGLGPGVEIDAVAGIERHADLIPRHKGEAAAVEAVVLHPLVLLVVHGCQADAVGAAGVGDIEGECLVRGEEPRALQGHTEDIRGELIARGAVEAVKHVHGEAEALHIMEGYAALRVGYVHGIRGGHGGFHDGEASAAAAGAVRVTGCCTGC